MKILKYWRELLILLLLITTIITARTCENKNSDINTLKNTSDSSYSVAKYYIDKNGKLEAQVKTHEITTNQLKEFNEQLGINEKELKKQVGSLNNLVTYYKGKAGINDTIYSHSVDTVIQYNGTQVIGKRFKWTNGYLTLDQTYNPSNDTLKTIYDYKFDFVLDTYRKKQGIFKSKQLVTDIHFSDESLTVTDFKGIVIKEPKKKFYQTGLFKFALSLGAGIAIMK